jgi:hypothetical protein
MSGKGQETHWVIEDIHINKNEVKSFLSQIGEIKARGRKKPNESNMVF